MSAKLLFKWVLVILGGGFLLVPSGPWLSLGSNLQTSGELLVCPQNCPFSSIQSAIDAASAGSTVRVLAGSYQENLKITKEMRLIGEDADRVTLKGLPEKEARRAPSEQVPVIRIEDATNVLVEGFALLGDKDLGNKGIEVRHGAEATIRNNTLQGFFHQAISVDDIGVGPVPRAFIIGNTLRGNGFGIWVFGGHATIEGNQLEDNGAGMVVQEGRGCCADAWETTTSQVYLSDNTLRGGHTAIYIDGGFLQASLIRNKINGTAYAGIRVSNLNLNPTQLLMYQNEVVNNQGWGMALWDVVLPVDLCLDLATTYSISNSRDFTLRVALDGQQNDIHGNQVSDVCPPDWPLPRGFLK